MNKENIADIYELSPLQQGILFHSICEPETGVYFIQLCYRLRGNLNVTAFEQAWQQVVARHTVLRTGFYWEKLEKPLQVVYKQVPVSIQHHDWRNETDFKNDQKLAAWLAKDRQEGFNLAQAPVMRWHLIQRGEDDYYFVWSKHHLILDGWSTALVLKEVLEIYQSLCQEKSFALSDPLPYSNYIGWLQQQDLSNAQEFWRKNLQGVKNPTSLEIRLGEEESARQGELSLKLSHSTTAKLQLLAKENHLTLNTLVQGAWALLLNRYTSETDLVYGVTVSGRPTNLTGAESMVGLFINTLPVRVQIEAEDSLISWLKQLQTQLLEIRNFESSPLVEIQGWSEVPRGLPLFESIVVFENYPVDRVLHQQETLTIENVTAFDYTNYPLTVTVIPGEELAIAIAYQTNCFDRATVSRMLGHLQTLLEGMVINPQTKLVDLPLLTATEQSQLLSFNQTSTTIAENKLQQCIPQLFEAQVTKTPDAVAVVFEDSQLTYRELNSKANQLAHYLQQNGVKSEIIVGICCDRSLEMVIGLLGILKAGGAYLPIDPSYPSERIKFIVEDAELNLILTQQHLRASLSFHQAQLICLDTDWENIAQQDCNNPINNATPESLAYVIYTSGSTGTPKGVMNTHRGICNRLLWMQEAYQLTVDDSVLQKTPFSFDVSVWEFFWTLSTGARLVIAKPGGHQDSAYLVKQISHHNITTIHFVPSMLQVFLEESEVETLTSLKRVICSGEALSVALQQRFFDRFARLNSELHNLYGPTEAAIDVTYWQCRADSNLNIIPIGRPIANTQIYILDRHLQPLPIGVPGEIHIGGVGVARGYLNRPELTKEKFIPNPFTVNNQQIYKTGDKARYLPSGNIEFLGRIDNQVKLRGFRIELGEIEAILNQHSLIKENVVILREDNLEDQKLVAYIVTLTNSRLPLPELRNFLREKLPEYAIPSAFVFLEQLPISANGKIDRKSLPIPTEIFDSTNNYTPPTNAIEEILAGIWAKILQRQRVGIYDNFFDLGGHSLLATQVISRIREAFAIELPIRCLFESPSVAQLAETLIIRENQPGIMEKRAQILKKLENMSPEQVKQLLQQRKATSKATLR
ncbi:MAG: amino acid adenylation domain-containing protein [Pleurocapsa minor HA4230-MV1]|jgi:amino acid adenylation domain-containing protein|nr:amino acid adenylation domain-containing protein [Pleurocapsa minor HA4230-MV1]